MENLNEEINKVKYLFNFKKGDLKSLIKEWDDGDNMLSTEISKLFTNTNGWSKKEYSDKHMWFKSLSEFPGNNGSCKTANMVVVLGEDFIIVYIDKDGQREYTQNMSNVYPNESENRYSTGVSDAFKRDIQKYFNDYIINGTPFKMWPYQVSCKKTTEQ